MKNKKNFLKIAIFAAMVFSLALAGSVTKAKAATDNSELKKIQEAIKEKGAKWVAGENEISKLSLEEKKMRANAKPIDMTGIEPVPMFSSVAIPANLDWNNNGGDFVTPIRDQGSCGSCWAFADTATLESYSLIKQNTPNQNLDLSEQILVSCSKAGSCGGGYVTKAATYIQSTGLPTESFFPYTATNNNCRNAIVGWKNNTYKIGSWGSVSKSVTNIKNALATYGPLATTFYVYDDFYYYDSGVYSYSFGNLLGGHAVMIVGYGDDATIPSGGYFIVKNSWGSGWGENGFFKVAYSELNTKVNFAGQTLAYLTTAPAPNPKPHK